MLTTREAINFQYSLIFGYASPRNEEIVVGEVIGPGFLTKNKVKELSYDVIKFLRMYNAIIRDYCGSEVYSIEFELYNVANLNIPFPKSMLLLPGRYKDCESLLLALKPETGQMNMHKSRISTDRVSNLFFEIEDFGDHPQLNNNEKELFLNKFASRFALKLYGDLLENRWNKKLIGLNESLPTEKERLNKYIDIRSKSDILWTEKPPKVNINDYKFRKVASSFEGKLQIEHLKYKISEPSANFIVEKTLELSSDLFNLANTGTIDETKEQIILFIVDTLKDNLQGIDSPYLVKEFIRKINELLKGIDVYFQDFLKYSREFLTSGNKGDIEKLLGTFIEYVCEKGISCKNDFEEISKIAINYFNQSIIEKIKLRAIDLSSGVNYFSELIKSSFDLIKNALPKYLARKKLMELQSDFISNLKKKLEKEQKPAKILGYQFVDNYQNFLKNIIEVHPLIVKSSGFYDDKSLNDAFHIILKENLEDFFNKFKLNISDITSFAEEEMEKDSNDIKQHIENFKKFSSEIHFLLSYILRYTTINRFLKTHSVEELDDLENFFDSFSRFLEKRTGGINLAWDKYMLSWIEDFIGKIHEDMIKNKLDFIETFEQFINYLEYRENYEQQAENFLDFLNIYIAEVKNPVQKPLLLEFFKQYEFCMDIKDEFPQYLKRMIKNEIDEFNFLEIPKLPLSYFKIKNGDTFISYLRDTELKYFSKLIPRPKSIILRQLLNTTEKEFFSGDLYHVFSFKYLKSIMEIEVNDNFKRVFSGVFS